jgi:hypothetical protein
MWNTFSESRFVVKILSVGRDRKSDFEAVKKMYLPWWLLLVLALSAELCVTVFRFLHRVDLALPVMNSIILFGYLIKLRWLWKSRTWFWMTLLFGAALHVALFLHVPWARSSIFAIGALDIVDFYSLLTVLTMVGRLRGAREDCDASASI